MGKLSIDEVQKLKASIYAISEDDEYLKTLGQYGSLIDTIESLYKELKSIEKESAKIPYICDKAYVSLDGVVRFCCQHSGCPDICPKWKSVVEDKK